MPKKRGKPNRRRLAALKGWRTRRRKQEKRNRAALKGWRTRRRNQEKRHRAALKGWRTRRRNQGGGGGIILRKKLRQFLVTTKYKPKKGKFRRLDFLVNAESKAEARKMVQKQMKLSRSGFSKWRVQISENLEARPRKKSIEVN